MSFNIPTTTTAASTGGFSFGLPTVTSPAKPPTLAFGTTPPTTNSPVKPLAFGAAAAAPTTTPATGFGGFGIAAPATTTNAFGINAAPQTAASTTNTLPTLTGFGSTPTAAPTFGTAAAPAFGTAAAPAFGTAAAPAFGTAATPTPAFGATSATTAAPTFSLGAPAPSAATATKPTLPLLTGFGTTPAPTTAAAPFSITKTTTATTLPTLGLGQVAPTVTQASAGFANLSSATKTTDSAAAISVSQMTFNQMQEQINKWTLELEEQEKVFTEQATQINAWDKVLIANNQKILELNEAAHKVKNDQQMLEQELEFIATQHNELEESIAPLQKEFSKMPQVDVERSQTYLMVENLDTQLKQMSEDLKEIIDNLNEASKGQDNTDPIIQIGKILNAHMSSLQWIELSSVNIQNKLEDINKMHERFKRDSERSFRSAYYN